MRRPIIIFGSLGVALLAAAALWALFAPGQLVKYPDDLNQTAVAQGTVTLFVDPSTGAASDTPQKLPLSINRNLRVVASTGSEATVQETSLEQIGPQAPARLQLRYVLDRTSLMNVADPAAFAYTPANRVNREGFYSINFPFETDAGPYQLFKNETGTAYAFRQAGDDVDRDGLTLRPMAGSLANAPLTDAYVEVLAGLGLRKQMTFAQFAPQLKAIGIDPAALTEQLLPALSSADRAAVAAMLAAPIPLRYDLTADTRLLVEPTTGAVVSLADVDQTISATPDLSRLAGLGTTLAKPEYADNEVVQGTLAALRNLPSGTRTEVMRMQYAQTDASVADIAAYAEDKASDIVLVKTLIPFGLTILGVVCLLGTAAIITARTRKRAAV